MNIPLNPPSELESYVKRPEEFLDDEQIRWLEPIGGCGPIAQRVIHALVVATMRTLFRLRVEGRERLPVQTPVILAPNHTSSLDGPALAAALDFSWLRQTYWAGRRGAVMKSRWRRWMNRLAQTLPMDRDPTGLAAGAAVLRRNRNLIWFPEGSRTTDGKLQPFKWGVGMLVRQFRVPVVPVFIDGAYEAMSPDAWMPRLCQISVVFGEPFCESEWSHLVTDNQSAEDEDAAVQTAQRIADLLHHRVKELQPKQRR